MAMLTGGSLLGLPARGSRESGRRRWPRRRRREWRRTWLEEGAPRARGPGSRPPRPAPRPARCRNASGTRRARPPWRGTGPTAPLPPCRALLFVVDRAAEDGRRGVRMAIEEPEVAPERLPAQPWIGVDRAQR